jgi:hypothetical protein
VSARKIPDVFWKFVNSASLQGQEVFSLLSLLENFH